MTDEMREKKKEQVIQALRANQHNVSNACEAVNVSRGWFYKMKKQDPEFAKRVDEIEERVTDTVVSALFRNAIDGNVTAQIFWLKNKRPDTWADRKEIAHSGLLSNPLELSEEEERREAEILGIEYEKDND